MLARVAALPVGAPAGTRFKYFDVGFITLGYLVERISDGRSTSSLQGMSFAVEDGRFDLQPNEKLKARVAPTGPAERKVILGTSTTPGLMHSRP